MRSHEGGCLCGAVRFQVTGPPLDSGYCHCRMCQRNSGAPAVAWVTFAASGFSWTAGAPRTYESSLQARRLFCGACGSYMVFLEDQRADEVSVNTASLDEPDNFPPRKHTYTDSRIAWFQTRDDLPSHALGSRPPESPPP